MTQNFFERPILNSPYQYPGCHWELVDGRPTNKIVEKRRSSDFYSPVPQSRKRTRRAKGQDTLLFTDEKGLSSAEQEYNPTPIINEIRGFVEQWRALPNPRDWNVTPETARLLTHWRHHEFSGIRPFFCQVEAVETAIWLAEVAPKMAAGAKFLEHLQSLPNVLLSAIDALYGHYKKTFEEWEREGMGVPPVFIFVCNNTTTSELIYKYVSGYVQTSEDGTEETFNGRLPLFDNFDSFRNRRSKPNTILIDSAQLEAGDALDKDFRDAAAAEIGQFKREIVERTGDREAAEKISDAELLREVMNTVGKKGRLGEQVRCVVSVSMLTEGWDANTVTHILGVRAFGTQLLCEQVVGRGLRRASYELNEDGLFNVEYADIFGIPFDFAADPVQPTPSKPRETIHVQAVRPDRDALEITFPRVEGYRLELPEERVDVKFNEDSVLNLTAELVGPTIAENKGIIGEGVTMTLEHLKDMRLSTVFYHLAWHLLTTKFRDASDEPKIMLFNHLKSVVRQWYDGGYLRCCDGTYPAQLIYRELADLAASRIAAAITLSQIGEKPVKAMVSAFNPTGSTAQVNFNTSKTLRWDASPTKSHVNWIICDSSWETEFCRVVESDARVICYAKNQGLGLEVPYVLGSVPRRYFPDFIVKVDDGQPDPLNLIVEVKGFRGEDAKEKANTMRAYWVPGVNNLKRFGRWEFIELRSGMSIADDFKTALDKLCGAAAPAHA